MPSVGKYSGSMEHQGLSIYIFVFLGLHFCAKIDMKEKQKKGTEDVPMKILFHIKLPGQQVAVNFHQLYP